ncbi:altered inheritance of mitochondria protein 21 [Apiosordaria backusii]|uniref:Altered inheritance of mitochondria protein 21 n=1 Tax=Apiosordaria backusii TaxID=314023 RepID=A0AA40ENA0_9PEZI|nr:altered inheritance of mitochondria protein 21 [Apiosordaria backusii]
MSTTTAQQPPVIPPRPSRSQERAPVPMVPPRPANRRFQRSISPNPDRFAPSPLNESPLVKSKSLHPGGRNHGDPIPRSTSVDLPSLGEEGAEYANLAQESSPSTEESTSPEHTRTVGEDVKLHAPKPSLPAASAKQRVMAVTRTDSDRAAAFGIGRPSSNDDYSTAALPSNRSLKKKASTTSQLSVKSDLDDEQGIPEIGIQVPMLKNAGDVQAPSPAPSTVEKKHHSRRSSSRGNLPPGSYGLHGHGVGPQDKLDKAYFEKHPELLKKEHVLHHYDRVKDFSMSSEELNKIVRETITRGSGLGVKNYSGTPTDQVAWQALEESTSRVASPGPASPKKPSSVISDSDKDKEGRRPSSISDVIHVEEPNHRRSVMFSENESPAIEEDAYEAPILAEDEVAKDPSPYVHQPAVELPQEEQPASRPPSRPASIYKEHSFEHRSTPLEDVEEYEPLFDDDDKVAKKQPVKEEKPKSVKKQRFPSADIWEDAPSSVYYTAEVSTPDLFEGEDKPEHAASIVPPARDGETPAQAFARHQEELAEKEVRERGADGFIPGRSAKPVWAKHQPHLLSETKPSSRPSMNNRFPSRDVWEDTPESLQLETTVSTPQQDDAVPSPVETSSPTTAVKKPEIPSRPKPKVSGDDNKPAIPERPKPAIPARPVKAGPTSGGLEPAEAAAPPRQKPAVPARPVGGKIAALQAGFMNDLNRRLQLGPQAPPVKKEEPAEEEEKEEEKKEKAPLVDARKGRARGPQRRAPSAKQEPPKEEPKPTVTFNVSSAFTFFEINPEEGDLSVGGGHPSLGEPELPVEKGQAEVELKPVEEEKKEEEEEVVEEKAEEKVAEPEAAPVPETKVEEPKVEEPKVEETKVEEPKVEENKPEAEAEPEKGEEPEPKKGIIEQVKALVTNMAGETVVEETVEKDEEKKTVEPVKVEEH